LARPIDKPLEDLVQVLVDALVLGIAQNESALGDLEIRSALVRLALGLMLHADAGVDLIGNLGNRQPQVVRRISDYSYELTRCACGYYCGCAGAVAGGGVAVGVVGVEPGSKYQTMISARTTAAAMMSNLFVSIGSTYCSLCRTTLAPLGALGQVTEKHHTAVRPIIRLLAER